MSKSSFLPSRRGDHLEIHHVFVAAACHDCWGATSAMISPGALYQHILHITGNCSLFPTVCVRSYVENFIWTLIPVPVHPAVFRNFTIALGRR